MDRRSRSISRSRDIDSIYDRAASPFSTKLNIRRPDIYNRASSVGPYEALSSQYDRAASSGRFDDYNRSRRAISLAPYEPYSGTRADGYFSYLRAKSPYRPYGLYDVDIYDRYTERIPDRTPIYLYNRVFTPSYWHLTAPRSMYYSYGEWSSKPIYYGFSGYPYYAPDDSYLKRYTASLDHIKRIHDSIRELDYRRALRQLKFHNPSLYYNPTSLDLLMSSRDDARELIRYKIGENSRFDNPKDYYGRSYIKMEKNGVDNVRSRYNYIGKNVSQRPISWNAEDQVETGYDLQDRNAETLPSILNNAYTIDKSREALLMDRAGVVPRLYHLGSDYIYTKSATNFSKQLLTDFKRLKDETLHRLSMPWSYGRYAN